MHEIIENATVMLPIRDIRFVNGGPYLTQETLLEQLIELGFRFEGAIDEDGRQSATLPKDWLFDGDRESTHWHIHDDRGRHRMTYIKKIPWGNHDFVHFLMIEPAIPNAKSISDGW